MAKDISISSVSVATSNGPKKYYSFDVIDPETGVPVKSFNTTDEQKAKKFLDQAKKDYPNATVNGESGTDPLNDGTLPSQGEYDIGGFETTNGTPKDIQPELNNYNPAAAGDSSLDPKGFPNRKTSGFPDPLKSKITKKARDLSYISNDRIAGYKQLTEKERGEKKINGLFGNKRMQAMAQRDTLGSELIVGRGPDNNAFIVIGNDRAEKAHTGWGGKGHTQCDAIDIVAGLGGHTPKEVKNKSPSPNEVKIKTNPSFFVDAARIYISQKTNVDKNFGLRKFKATVEDETDIGKYGAKSAIAAKADNIRIIARESLHLVTGTDKFNSQGGEVLGKTGVELIAMNQHEDVQPLVLGDNLQIALITIIDNLEAIAKIMHGYIKYQMKYNQALQQHTHVSPFFGILTLPSEAAIVSGIQCDIETTAKTEISVLKHITNLQGLKTEFLVDSGDSFINSRYNKCN